MMCIKRRKSAQQECILVGCVPSAAVAVSPATHTHTHLATHVPLPDMSLSATHTPCHACPPAMHTLLPCMPLAIPPATCRLPCPPTCHAHPLPHASPTTHEYPPATHIPRAMYDHCNACPPATYAPQ